MSYILEALNKSESERRGQQTPDLNTVHRAPPTKTQSRAPWLIVIAVFALINIAGLTYWLSMSDDTSMASIPAGQPAEAVNQPSVAAPANTNQTQIPVTQATSGASVSPAAAPSNAVTPNNTLAPNNAAALAPQASDQNNQDLLITPDSAFRSKAQDAVRITELPLNVQRQVPDLVFSSHLYSSDASFRMVNINGKMMREGDMVANDLKLEEISEEGVVLSYLHYLFEVSVLRDWSFN